MRSYIQAQKFVVQKLGEKGGKDKSLLKIQGVPKNVYTF